MCRRQALALATMAKSSHLLATERAGLAETAASLRAAGVVGPRTIAALDAIIAACRSAGPGRASRVRPLPLPPACRSLCTAQCNLA